MNMPVSHKSYSYSKWFLSLLVPLLLCAGCSDKKQGNTDFKIVDIDLESSPEPIMLSQIANNLAYTHLESDDYSFLADVSSVKLFNNKYFVLDKFQNTIVIFDLEGKYLDRLQQIGNGPGEYGKIDFFDLNEKNKTIEIYDVRKGSVFRYDLFGNFLKRIRATLICRDFITTVNGDYLFYSPDETNNFNNSGIILEPGLIHVTRDGKSARLVFKLGDPAYSPLLVSKSFVKYEESIYLFSNYTDTVFKIDKNLKTDRLVLDYGVKIDERALLNPDFNISEANFPFLKLNPTVTKTNIAYSFLYKGKDMSVIIDKNSLSSQIYRGIQNDLDSGFFTFNGDVIGKSDYISILTSEMADAYLEYYSKAGSDSTTYRMSNLIDEMTANNKNPVLVKVSLK